MRSDFPYDELIVVEAVLLCLYYNPDGVTVPEMARILVRDPRWITSKLHEHEGVGLVRVAGTRGQPYHATIYELTDKGTADALNILKVQEKRRIQAGPRDKAQANEFLRIAVAYITAPGSPYSADTKAKLREDWDRIQKGG